MISISCLKIFIFVVVCFTSSLATDSIITNATYSSSLKLYFDPPPGTTTPHAMGVHVWSNDDSAAIYYELSSTVVDPTFSSSIANYSSPYIQIVTPFKASRNRTLTIVAVTTDGQGNSYRSDQISVNYFVEAAARPYAYGFLVPGIESGGYFILFAMEVAATARAQAAGSQEFADFYTNLGIGTYSSQIQALDLLAIDSDLQGFEGGFNFNTTHGTKHFGLLIPYHNGNKYFGKVVKINLQTMINVTNCQGSYVKETLLSNGTIHYEGTANVSTACVHIIDLTSLHSKAKGFRRGFLGYPYAYLSPGEGSVAVRIDVRKFGLNHTRVIDLSLLDSTFGGYSGGFADGHWACFNPYRTYSGNIGGIRSALQVDLNNFRPYYYSTMVCLNESAWNAVPGSDAQKKMYRTLDLSSIEQNLRGFSDALRVGRYAYLSPLNSADKTFTSKVLRIRLGKNNIGEQIDTVKSTYGNIRSMVDILDLAKINSTLAGYSGLFYSGHYLILVPYRNSYEPKNGQRGHGFVTRIDMNDFTLNGVEYLDLSTATRNQIPSYAEANFRGFSGGFASGQYALLVPFFNADFNGKIARFYAVSGLSSDLQQLDLTVDRKRKNTYKGYRGGFVSLWQGVDA